MPWNSRFGWADSMLSLIAALAVLSGLAACSSGGGGTSSSPPPPPPPPTLESRLSAAVALVHSDAAVQAFLQQPGTGYVEAWFNFPATLAEDVWFGIDQELIEGVDNPRNFQGADWMGLVAVNRSGQLGTPVGSAASHAGTPDDAMDWVIQDLGVTLQPDTWYRLRGEVDFSTLTFSSMQLQGPGVDVSVDLSGLLLSYPNYIPFDRPFMTYYVFALRAAEFAQPGSTVVYFDDVEGGIDTPGGMQAVFSDGFENQSTYVDIPVSLPVSPLDDVTEFQWYKERDESLISSSNARQRTGNFSIACDATLVE